MTGTGLFSWDAMCFECDQRYAMLTPRSEATYEWRGDCPSCGTQGRVQRVPSAPMVLAASWPDGHNRSDLAGLKEAAKLELALESADPETREKEVKSIQKFHGG